MINNSEFLLKSIEDINPFLNEYEYIDYWKSIKRRIFEGERIGGKWMPGPLWYGCNFHKIPLEEDEGNQSYGNVFVRDIDWPIYYYYEEARGFSGFTHSTKSSNRLLLEELTDEELVEKCSFRGILNKKLYDNLFLPTGQRKEYVSANEELNRTQSDCGKAVYYNSAKNFMTMGSRGWGKTVIASVLCNHNIITDGMTDYDLYLENLSAKKVMRSTTLVSSQETKYVSQIKDYIKAALEQYPGMYVYGEQSKPSPLEKGYLGSWDKNNESGIKFNSGSSLIWRVFGDNSFSANSGRPNLSIIDEFAFVRNIKDILSSIEGADASKRRKNNVIWMQATGGYAKGDTVRYAESLYYNPDAFNFMSFEDEWEGRGKIGHFTSVLQGSMAYKKGENLITDLDLASKTEHRKRADKKGDRDALQGYIVNHPIVPSECFLLGDNNIFPSTALKEQYAALMEGGVSHHKLDLSFKGYFKKNVEGNIEFEITNDNPIREYPLINSNEYKRKGVFELFQKPITDVNGVIKKGRYIASADVVRNDDPGQSESLPSLFILDRNTRQIVAEYTGRTNNTKDFYEQVLYSLLYYNATIMYEQNIKDMFTYFDQRKCLHLLADTPYQLRNKEAPFIENMNTSKGINNQGRAIIEGGLKYINSWLMERSFVDNNKYQVDHIDSPALLLELIKYNGNNNCDRVSSLIMLFWYDETMEQDRLKESKQKREDFTSAYLKYAQDRKMVS